jgi:hypothetical protein
MQYDFIINTHLLINLSIIYKHELINSCTNTFCTSSKSLILNIIDHLLYIMFGSISMYLIMIYNNNNNQYILTLILLSSLLTFLYLSLVSFKPWYFHCCILQFITWYYTLLIIYMPNSPT